MSAYSICPHGKVPGSPAFMDCPECEAAKPPVAQLERALCDLLEWAKGNRGRQDGNPYGVPEVRKALKALQRLRGLPAKDFLDANTRTISIA